jgi:hypothetical protein
LQNARGQRGQRGQRPKHVHGCVPVSVADIGQQRQPTIKGVPLSDEAATTCPCEQAEKSSPVAESMDALFAAHVLKACAKKKETPCRFAKFPGSAGSAGSAPRSTSMVRSRSVYRANCQPTIKDRRSVDGLHCGQAKESSFVLQSNGRPLTE